jgi:hypothetical protein
MNECVFALGRRKKADASVDVRSFPKPFHLNMLFYSGMVLKMVHFNQEKNTNPFSLHLITLLWSNQTNLVHFLVLC